MLSAEEVQVNKQLAEVDPDLARAQKELDAAQNRVSRADYDKLKAELDALQLQQQKQFIAPAADVAQKQREFADPQKKKAAFEQAIKALRMTS